MSINVGQVRILVLFISADLMPRNLDRRIEVSFTFMLFDLRITKHII